MNFSFMISVRAWSKLEALLPKEENHVIILSSLLPLPLIQRMITVKELCISCVYSVSFSSTSVVSEPSCKACISASKDNISRQSTSTSGQKLTRISGTFRLEYRELGAFPRTLLRLQTITYRCSLF